MFRIGLGNSGCTLTARYDPTIPGAYWITNEVLFGRTRIWFIPADTQPDESFFPFTLVRGTGNFPWQFDVLPDGPP